MCKRPTGIQSYLSCEAGLKTCLIGVLESRREISWKKMSEKKKTVKLPTGANAELNVSKCPKKQWSEEAESCADRLATAAWQSYKSRPRGDGSGYFVVLRWYNKEKAWVPLYMNHGNVSNCLAKLFSTREATPICKYLSSFPRSERKLLWVKWLMDPPSRSTKDESVAPFKEVLKAFSAKYNQGETLPFNMDDEPDVPEHFSLLDF